MRIALERIADDSKTYKPKRCPVGLFSGKAGMALFYAYLYRWSGDQDHFEQFSLLLDECLAGMGNATMGSSFVGGIAGVSWLVRHLIDIELLEESSLDSLEVVEKYILKSLARDKETKRFEIFRGLTGKGLCFLEGPMTAAGQEGIEQILTILQSGAIPTDGGIAWTTKSWRGDELYFDLGIPHGVTGIILFLCRVSRTNIQRDLVLELIDGAVRWLLAQEKHMGIGYFPHIVGREFAGRLAWCYGDMCVATALLAAAEVLSLPPLKEKAIGILDKEVGRNIDSARVFKHPRYNIHDRGLCHGTAGIALCFNSFYKKTGIESLRGARDYWTDITLSIKKTGIGKGIGGYIFPSTSDKNIWQKNPYVLDGALGVGLSYLTLLNEDQLPWERMFLLC
ncbi:hypothetical protein A3860_05355 [Niastella vici]|uniref:Lanthionine synthetase n=2 Tax=Niastella vici TaxID=1703345 RepID=A0A1V9FSC0_9BACT|nr:hypothetical protein A3860_05355 [Niastella vici]